jgi:hypothetical protein
MGRTIVSTVAIAGILLVVTLLVAGCGAVVRRAMIRSSGRGLCPADLWIGLGALLVYLQVWNLLAGIGRSAWIVPLVFGAAGLVAAFGRIRPTRDAGFTGAFALVGVVWLANRALGPAADYDFGLYHAAAIEYASRFAAIPGLGNLHDRLGAGDAHFLFVALLDRGPWDLAGIHLANGVLVTMLLLEIAYRVAVSPRLPFTTRAALLLVPATIVVIGTGSSYRLSSPNIDLACFIFVAAGSLQIAECVERGFDRTAAVASTTAFALAAVTRPLFLVPAAIAVVVILVAGVRRGGHGLLAAAILPAALVLTWGARQAVLSGYPLYPLTVVGVPADWRMSATAVERMNRIDEAWARLPAADPDRVLATWHWLRPWLDRRATDLDTLFPLLLLCALSPSLARRRRIGPPPPAALAILAPALATLVVWWLLAPDPRFVLAPLWLVPIALVGAALPAFDRSALRAAWPFVGAYALLIALALTRIGLVATKWLVPAGLLAWVAAAAWQVLSRKERTGRALAYAAVACCAVVPVAVVARSGAFRPLAADGNGPLRTVSVPRPRTLSFAPVSGLRLRRPVNGDRCFGVLLCTPEHDVRIRLRGRGIDGGFAPVQLRRRAASTTARVASAH